MKLRKILLSSVMLAMKQSSVAGFLPSKKIGQATAPLPKKTHLPIQRLPQRAPQQRSSTASYAGLTELLSEPVPTDGLIFGWVVLCAAMTPYVFQLFAPWPLRFFLANYYGGKDIEELREMGYSEDLIAELVESGRVAEVEWKVSFATLCLAISTIAFFEVFNGADVTRVLRDSYVAWGVFYIYATAKIRKEALSEPSILKRESRFLIQAWHILVTVLLWASLSETVTGNAIRKFVTDLFTF